MVIAVAVELDLLISMGSNGVCKTWYTSPKTEAADPLETITIIFYVKACEKYGLFIYDDKVIVNVPAPDITVVAGYSTIHLGIGNA